MEPHREMQVHLIRYFQEERRGSLLFLGAGAAALAAAALLLATSSPHRAMAWPLALLGLVEFAVGGSVFLRTGRQMGALSRLLESSPASYRDEELARMGRVLAGFRVYWWAEVAVLAAGVALALLARGPAWRAAGLGCALQATVLLALDHSVEGRARAYSGEIQRLLGGGRG